MDKKLLFIINPRAGRVSIRAHLLDILDVFIKAGYTVSTYLTQKPNDAREYSHAHGAEYDIIVCCGGDGTLSETVNGIAALGAPPRIGYISAGTTNDVGYSLSLPADMTEAAKTAVSGTPFRWDVGEFGDGRYFCYVAAFGLFTDVTYTTSQAAKNVWGRAAYILEGSKRIGSVPRYHAVIDCDGEKYEGDYILALIANTVSVGGFRSVFGGLPKLDDGLFEVALIKTPANIAEMQHVIGLLLQLESMKDVHSDFLQVVRGSRVHIETDVPIPWTLDGEYGGTLDAVTVNNRRQLLTIMTGMDAQKTEK